MVKGENVFLSWFSSNTVLPFYRFSSGIYGEDPIYTDPTA